MGHASLSSSEAYPSLFLRYGGICKYSRKTFGRLSQSFVINDAQTNTISQTDGQKETRTEAGSWEISELQHKQQQRGSCISS